MRILIHLDPNLTPCNDTKLKICFLCGYYLFEGEGAGISLKFHSLACRGEVWRASIDCLDKSESGGNRRVNTGGRLIPLTVTMVTDCLSM